MSIIDNDNSVTVQFDDGTTAIGSNVVGCDSGIWSIRLLLEACIDSCVVYSLVRSSVLEPEQNVLESSPTLVWVSVQVHYCEGQHSLASEFLHKIYS